MNFYEFPQNFNWRACPRAFFSLKWSLFPSRPQGVLKASFWVPKASVWVPQASFWLRQASFWLRQASFWVRRASFWVPLASFWVPRILGSQHPGIRACRHPGIRILGSWDPGIPASRHSRPSQHPGIPASRHPGFLDPYSTSALTPPQRLLHLNAYST